MHNKRTIRQFNYTFKKIKKYISSGEWLGFNEKQRDKILNRLNCLIQKIGNASIIRGCIKMLLGLGLFVLTGKGGIAQNYQAALINPFGLAGNLTYNYHTSPTFVDIDADGDLDLFISGSYLTFHENIGTATIPSFGPSQMPPFNLVSPPAYFHSDFGDLDNDGDMDVIFGRFNGTISFQENIGTANLPNFGPIQNNPFGITNAGSQSDVELVDIDGDGDLDLMVGAYVGGATSNIHLFTNTGTPTIPNFSAPVTNPMGISPPALSLNGFINLYFSINFGDVDCDGDIDLLTGGSHDGTIYFQENTSSNLIPVFSPIIQTMPFGLNIANVSKEFMTPELADMDNDGDLDLLIGDEEHLEIRYFEMICCLTTYDTSNVSDCKSYTSPSGKSIWNTPGTYNDTIPNAAGCDSLLTINLTILPKDDATFSFQNISYCLTDANPTPIIPSTTGGTFSINNSGSVNPTTGQIDLANSRTGNFIITYTTNGTCPDTIASNIDIIDCTLKAVYTASDTTICEGECVIFTDQSINATTWKWTFNGGTPNTANNEGPHTVCFDNAGTHNIEQIVNNGNTSDTTNSSIVVNEIPTINTGNDTIIKLGESTLLTATSTNGSYTWAPSIGLDCATCLTSLAKPQETTAYTLTITDSNNCIASDEITVKVNFDIVIFVPNIFSPNGDGNNDFLHVRGKGIKSLNFIIYDRWGEKVFETQNLDIGWDGKFRGKPMNNGVFFYYLKAFFIDGTKTEQKGDFTLIK